MMDPSEKHSFEEQWKRVFEEASEIPPKSVWEGIEAHLDRDEDKIVPLPWWNSSKVWYVAASLAALLLVGAGIWYNNASTIIRHHSPVAVRESGKTTASTEKEAEITAHAKEQANSGIEETAEKPGEPVAAATSASVATAGAERGSNESSSRISDDVAAKEGSQLAQANEKVSPDEMADRNGFAAIRSSGLPDRNETSGLEKHAAPAESAVIALLEQSTETVSPGILSPVGMKELDVHVQKRYVFFRPAMQEELPALPKAKKEYWAGVSFMPATFSPDIKVKSAPQNFSSVAIASQKATSGSSKEGFSYAYQTSGGVKLSKHWSMELGVSYLTGNSSYEGGGYLLNLSSDGQPTNVLESAYAGINSSKTQNSPSFGDNKSNNLYINVTKDIRNDYRYLQMPVQAGFTLNPNGKWSYSLLGGLMANFFLRNDLESASGAIITTTAADDVYKAVNLAATTGLRLNYKLSTRWRANLTGSYQKAIDSGIRSNQSLDSKPYLYGVSWGVRYSF
ncbi:hypothetical protein DYBT9275_05031 [Dyadobacter sp. CECT 9275]|uniref:Outer membrane protein beta-barrel domain-containing protein n=1 Tax=Dyadobacter helix TaxID=2822344 RepID=A0A916JG76_9BACT|nr:autotransporter outer membrane beta-barrel domain-containing protein [Dyadobacter sp. CECT 9275]CAG5011813.1 hypothetical protein DYBT9275_05031 [Dyadobacter sp. CECT 9275]